MPSCLFRGRMDTRAWLKRPHMHTVDSSHNVDTDTSLRDDADDDDDDDDDNQDKDEVDGDDDLIIYYNSMCVSGHL